MMRSMVYVISRAMAKIGSPWSMAALLCGVALLTVLLMPKDTLTQPANIGLTGPTTQVIFAIVTCLCNDPLQVCRPAVVDSTQATLREEDACDPMNSDSTCAGCNEAIAHNLILSCKGTCELSLQTNAIPTADGYNLIMHNTVATGIVIGSDI